MQRRQLFLDLHHVTRMERLTRRLHQPKRHPENPVLLGENPWERFVSLYGTVMYDKRQQLFRMWYLTGPASSEMVMVRGRKALGNITLLGYATSTDGVHWEKPNLGQLVFEGSQDNNLIDIGRTNCEGIAIIYDERDPDPQRRYKGYYWEHGGIDTFTTHESGRVLWGKGEGDGMWLSYSPDGIHWTNCPDNPVIAQDSDTTQSLLWDPVLEKYVVFGRIGAGGRRVGRAESEDCLHFSEPELVFAPDEVDEEGTQFYGMPVNLYEGRYLGMVWVYREGVDGTIDTSLATSRNGIRWECVIDRQTFLSLGPEDSWEGGMVRVCQDLIVRDDTIYLYYGGVHGPHGGRKFKQVERKHTAMIGLATLRRDGFVSLDADVDEGMMLTKPFTLEGHELHINADAHEGCVIASLTDDVGKPLTGYTSKPLSQDTMDTPLRFERGLGELQGKEVRLKILMTKARIYSYWFAWSG